MAEPNVQAATQAATILRLTVERFRCLRSFQWYPEAGLNLILGGGDVGKSTILEAVSLLLYPGTSWNLSDTDYWHREVEHGFTIEAVMRLPPDVEVVRERKLFLPWAWDGKEPILPTPESVGEADDGVFVFRVRGSGDLELAYEVVQPNDGAESLGVGVRRRIGLVRLGGDDRNDRDLRLVQGSALDRLVSDAGLRSRLGPRVGEVDVAAELKPEGGEALDQLEASFEGAGLPTGLDIGIIGSPGHSLNALIGLRAKEDGMHLPLASWGAGTRRLATLKIAAVRQGDRPPTIVDELERGLEPYRQRALVGELIASGAQVFATTHSAAAVGAAGDAALWYLGGERRMGRIAKRARRHQQKDPDAFLARLTVVAEGKTEVGFVTSLLERAVGPDLLLLGVWVTDADGHEAALELLEDLSTSGLTFAGFVDEEAKHPERWERLRDKLGALLFRWELGCLEENIVRHVSEDKIEELIEDPEGVLGGERRRTLQERLKAPQKDLGTLSAACADLRVVITEAATGKVPPGTPPEHKKAFLRHSQRWFKSEGGGREIGEKLFSLGVWPAVAAELLPFINSVRAAVQLDAIEELE